MQLLSFLKPPLGLTTTCEPAGSGQTSPFSTHTKAQRLVMVRKGAIPRYAQAAVQLFQAVTPPQLFQAGTLFQLFQAEQLRLLT